MALVQACIWACVPGSSQKEPVAQRHSLLVACAAQGQSGACSGPGEDQPSFALGFPGEQGTSSTPTPLPLSFFPRRATRSTGSFLPGRARVLDAQLTARVSYAPNGFSQVKVLQAARANAIFRWDKVTVLLETVRFTIKPIDQSLELALRRDA